MATLAERINDLAVAIKNKFNSISPFLLPAGGTGGQVLTKTGPGAGDKAWLDPVGGSLSDVGTGGLLFQAGSSDPVPAPAGKLNVHARSIAGRVMPGWVGPAGIDSLVQPILGMNKVIAFSATGGTATPGNIIGTSGLTATGTATARNSANYNSIYQRMRRVAYVSSATAGSVAGVKSPYSQATTGNGSGLGGFFSVTRFAISDAAPVAGARMFVGMDTSGAAGANVEPSTMTNCIGVGHGAADTNFKIFSGAGAANAPIDLGADFPIDSALNAANGDVYELIIFASPIETNAAYVQLTRLNTGHTVTHRVTGLPSHTVALNPIRIQRSNNAQALAVAVDLVSFYYETDY